MTKDIPTPTSINPFPAFPKERKDLPEAFKNVYVQEYQVNRKGESFMTKLSMKVEDWLHKKVASQAIHGDTILEIGAGTLNHLKWEQKYRQYTIVEPFIELFQDSPELKKIANIYDNIYKISTEQKFDRIISIAVLEHVLDLPALIAYSGILLNAHGQFQASIPNQGGLAWYLTYNLTTGLSYYLRNKLNYNILMRYEHVNTCTEIEEIVKFFFSNVTVVRYPLPFMNLSWYSYIDARNPDRDKCMAYIKEMDIIK